MLRVYHSLCENLLYPFEEFPVVFHNAIGMRDDKDIKKSLEHIQISEEKRKVFDEFDRRDMPWYLRIFA
jgi:hypothetical protein